MLIVPQRTQIQILIFFNAGLVNKWISWGVSDHVKASQEPIIFWKHKCALIDHNIFMKQIRSIIEILNHSGKFFGGYFYI